MKFSEKLTVLRKKHGYSQEQLSLELGVSRQTVYKWEAGINVPELEKIKQIAKMFDVSYDILLNDEVGLELSATTSCTTREAMPTSDSERKEKRFPLAIVITAICLAVALLVIGITLIVLNITKNDNVLTPKNCSHNEKYMEYEYIKAPTCVDKGIKRNICTLCKYYFDTEVEQSAHNYETKIIQQPTCTQGGVKRRICSGCNDFSDTQVEKLGHNYEMTTAVEPTYTSGGINKFSCKLCSDKYEAPCDPLTFDRSVYSCNILVSTQKGSRIKFNVETPPAANGEALPLYLYVNDSLLWEGEIILTSPDTEFTFSDTYVGGENIIILDEAIPRIETVLLTNKKLPAEEEKVTDPSELKILYVSKYLQEDGYCDSFLYYALKSLGCNINSEDMYSSYDELSCKPGGYDLYIFEGVSPHDVITDGVVWHIDAQTMPASSGVIIDTEEQINTQYGFDIFNSEDENALHEIMSGVDFEGSVILAFRSIISAQGLSPVCCVKDDLGAYHNVLMAGSIDGVKTVISTFDFSKSELPTKSDFVAFIDNLIQYSFRE